MNVFSGDIRIPTAEIAARDHQPVLPDVENVASLNIDETSTEFAVALAKLVKPDAQTKHKNTLANKPIEIDFPSERTAFVVGIDKLMTQPNSAVQQGDEPKGFVVDVRQDGQLATTIQSTPNTINSAQEVRQENNKLVTLKPNADMPAINTGLIKNIQPALAVIAKPKTGQSQINGTVFVDIEGAQEKTTPNKISIEAPITLQPKQQNPNVMPTLLPAHNFVETNANHGQVTVHELQPSPTGETNLRLQTPVHGPPQIQTPTISHDVPQTVAQAMITQIREPLSEHLSTTYDVLKNRSTDKPKDIIVQLSPAELGRVQIRFSFDTGERVVAQIVAENHETMAVLRQKSGLLLAQLKHGGFENIDLSFDASGQKNFSGQNSNTGSFNNQNSQSDTNLWQAIKTDLEKDTPQSSSDDNVYPLRTHMHAQSEQIDIVL